MACGRRELWTEWSDVSEAEEWRGGVGDVEASSGRGCGRRWERPTELELGGSRWVVCGSEQGGPLGGLSCEPHFAGCEC